MTIGMPSRMFAMILLAATTQLCVMAHAAGEARLERQFREEVYPIFRQHCLECHSAKREEGGLRLDDRSAWMSSSSADHTKATSELLRRIRLPSGHEEAMPAIGQGLTQRQKAAIEFWWTSGAVWPEGFPAATHWAYIPPERPALPEVTTASWCRTPLDYFVLSRLEDRNLKPSRDASPEKLVRRLHLDLVGLPPTPEEVDAFVADPSDEHYLRIVQELLQRPQFGERWARGWLDLARYADSHGFQRDNLIDIWAYRDWVIQALNADMPFDQFTIEQLAGDLLGSEQQKIATGFHRCAPTNVEAGSLPEETRVEQVIDRVNTTAAIWLGTTLECCQCHDHKYDPFTMEDYYRLFAFFNSTALEADRTNPSVPSSIQFQGPYFDLPDHERDHRRSELQEQIETVEQQASTRRDELKEQLGTLAATLKLRLDSLAREYPLEVVDFRSTGTTDTFAKQADGSILLVGDDPPDTDVYSIVLRGEVAQIRGLRLDALRHDSLPGKGPGRGDPKRTNFVLNRFTAELWEGSSDDASVTHGPLEFATAKASFSQKNWEVAGALKAQPKTGWAISPQIDRSHWATFILDKPFDLSSQQQLVVRLHHEFGQARSIGCLRISAVTGDISGDSIPENICDIVQADESQWDSLQRQALLDFCISEDSASQKLNTRKSALEKQLAAISPDTTLVMEELEEPRLTNMFIRGDYKQVGQPVAPGTPRALHDPDQGPANRLTLARWLVDRRNPLVARVTVNRWWYELFGTGLVSTLNDFGVKGEMPTHPELLDWLAVEFMENTWSLKHILQTIVLSSTYRQSSEVTPELLELDDQNRWLARGPRFRMDAEMIRDNALAVSGLLSLKQFGPPIRPFQPAGIWTKVGGTAYEYEVSPDSDKYRRGLYVVIKRGSPYPSFINFDATNRFSCIVKRSRTNTPLQALTLLNDPVYVEAAQSLANRLQIEKSQGDNREKIAYGFQLCTARRPSANEAAALESLWQSLCMASQEQGRPEGEAKNGAWLSVATVLLNLHETVTKD
ncbi:MAG: PSD1 domain-containing protein [Planctomycetales bacterium]|nr:PSD1 domain-containing protein [Planctomycetales bacterium]